MPWKIVNLDYDAKRPHLHQADIRPPGVHMRIFFDDHSVEVLVGGGKNIYRSPVQAIVTPTSIDVRAFWFNALYVKIVDHVLVSVDVSVTDRLQALGWMYERMAKKPEGEQYVSEHYTRDDGASWVGNVTGSAKSFVENFGWPFELSDVALAESIRDPAQPRPRRNALFAEARRRGLVGQASDD